MNGARTKASLSDLPQVTFATPRCTLSQACVGDDFMNIAEYLIQFGIAGLGVVAVFFIFVIGLPVYLYHRREVMRLKGTQAREVSKLTERIESLDKRCQKLEEQVTAAHLLLDDERRQMDRKLATMLPDTPSEPESTSRRKDRNRVRE
jgi:hypothetical protein